MRKCKRCRRMMPDHLYVETIIIKQAGVGFSTSNHVLNDICPICVFQIRGNVCEGTKEQSRYDEALRYK